MKTDVCLEELLRFNGQGCPERQTEKTWNFWLVKAKRKEHMKKEIR